jgi:hypothetical protein
MYKAHCDQANPLGWAGLRVFQHRFQTLNCSSVVSVGVSWPRSLSSINKQTLALAPREHVVRQSRKRVFIR